MTDPRRFHPAEIGLELDELSRGLVETARDLELYAATGLAAPTVGFEDRVMAAIAVEPMPHPTRGLGFLATVREAWAVAFGAGRPIAMRAQALALLLLLAVAVGSVGSVAVVGASRLLGPAVPPPTTPSPAPSLLPSPSLVPTSPPPSVSPTPPATRSPRPTATETDEPTGTDDSGGSGGSGRGSGSGSSGSGSDSSGPGSGPED